MGQFSWYTQDTKRRIVAGKNQRIIMTDNHGRQYVEDYYDGYGNFGGKDYYELMAEMNGLGSDREKGITLAFKNSPKGENPEAIFPSLTESGQYYNGESPKTDPLQGFVSPFLLEEDAVQDFWRLIDERDGDILACFWFNYPECKDCQEIIKILKDDLDSDYIHLNSLEHFDREDALQYAAEELLTIIQKGKEVWIASN